MPNKLDQAGDKQTAAAERREARRYAFTCTAELTDLAGSARISARTSDLSLSGCYIDTMNPFPVGTGVRLWLTKNGQRVEFRAEVTSCHMGSGMGLIFEAVSPAQKDALGSWLHGDSTPSDAPFEAAPAAAPSEGEPTANPRLGVRLVRILERKGILTHSEAAELLRDLD